MKYRNLLFFCIVALFVQLIGISAQNAAVHNQRDTKNYLQTFKERFQSILGQSLLSTVTAENKIFSAPDLPASDFENAQSAEIYSKKVQALMNSPVFERFDNWLKERTENNVADKSEHNALGERLAAERREALDELMKLSPQAALEKAIPADALKNLPSSIKDKSEKRISAIGDFIVYVMDDFDHATGKLGNSRTEREVVIGEARYKALVYGRRELMTTKMAIPLQGIIIGDMMVVDENPARVLDAAEISEKSATAEAGVAAEIGGKIKRFADKQQLNGFVSEQIEWESKIGPTRDAETSEKALASGWTEGQKSVLVIRVDFPDRPGEPITAAEGLRLMNNEVNPFYLNSSYNKTSLVTTVTPLLRLPLPQSSYSANALLSDAYAAARAAGYDVNNYNLDVTMFAYTSRFGWAGLASVGGRGNLINGAWQIEVVAHELGHNYGLLHANQWRSSDTTSPIGAGSNVEYGDCYDLMGACYNMSPYAYFNTHYKRLLNWLSAAEVQTVTSSGTYRVYAQDSNTTGNVRTLKINKDASKNYWIEFRQKLGGNSANGALLRWDYASKSYQETQLLDMNPATTSVADAPLLVGQSFYDSASRIRITVVGKGGTSPESLDVRVELDSNNTTTPTPTPSVTPTATPTPSCTYALTPTSASVSVAGANGSFTVSTQTGCTWSAVSNQNFVTVTSGNSGSGTGTVGYFVSANTGVARTGTISVGGKTFTVSQAGATTGAYSLVATPTNIAPGGQWTVSFTAPAGASYYDWVGLFKVGTPNSAYLNYGYTTGLTAGNFTVVAPNEPGQYEFRYLLNNSTATSVITSNTVTVGVTTTPTPTPATPTPTPVVPTPTPTPATPTPTPATPTPTPATPTPTPNIQRTNVAAASSGATATASSDSGAAYAASGAINGSRVWANGAGWRDGTPGAFPDALQIDFASSRTINEITVYSVRDDFASYAEPQAGEQFSLYGITDFEVQYWTGANWATVSGGSVSGNNQLVRQIVFNAVTTSRIRLVVNNGLNSYSRVVEVEAWTGGTVTATPTPTPATPTPTPATPTPTPATPTPTPNIQRTNVAAASSGATATASSDSGAAYAASGAINGSRVWANGAGWRDGTPGSFPDTLQVDFNAVKTIDEIALYFVRDDFSSYAEPQAGEQFSLYGVTDFGVQYWTGAAWATVQNGSVSGNNQLVRRINFAPVSTSRIRVVVSGGQNSYSRIVELEAWGGGSAYVLGGAEQVPGTEKSFSEKVADLFNHAYDAVSGTEASSQTVVMP